MVGPIYDDYVAESPDTVLLQNDDRGKRKKAHADFSHLRVCGDGIVTDWYAHAVCTAV